MQTNSTKIKAVGYCRFSSSMQREESIDAQKRFISNYAETCGYEITRWYCDEAKSGRTDDRPEFQNMIKDAMEGNIDTIMVHKLDRFSRNVKDTLYYFGLFKDYNINLISIAEKIDDSPVGKMLLTVLAGFNEYYVNNPSGEVKKGLCENAYKAIWTGGTPPLGYDVDENTHKLIINQAEAECVKLIFNMVKDGYGYGQIIDRLNLLGYKTKKGNTFGKNSLNEIISNERYKGVFYYNKRASMRNSDHKRNNHEYKSNAEIITVPGGCPAIVSEELWNKANALRKTSGKYKTNAKHPYLLTGFMYCEKCGYAMQGSVRQKSNGTKQTVYRCSARYNKRTCNCKEIKTSIVDDFVLDKLFKDLFTDSNLNKITSSINAKRKQSLADDENYNKVKTSMESNILARDKLVEILVKTDNNEAIIEKINSIEEDIKSQKEYLTIADSKANCEITLEEVKENLSEVKDYMKNKLTNEQIKLLLRSFIDRITIGDNDIKVWFKYKDPSSDDDLSIIFQESTTRKVLEKVSWTYGKGPRITSDIKVPITE